MQKFTVRGGAIAWPQVCACCLAPGTHYVTSAKTKGLFLGVATVSRTFTVKVPYCEPCSKHVVWNEGSGSPGIILWATAIFLGCSILGGTLAGVWLQMLAGPPGKSPALLPVVALLFFSCAAPFAIAFFYAKRKMRDRPTAPIDASHVRPKHAVEVLDFGTDSATVAVHNDRYAGLFSKANPA